MKMCLSLVMNSNKIFLFESSYKSYWANYRDHIIMLNWVRFYFLTVLDNKTNQVKITRMLVFYIWKALLL